MRVGLVHPVSQKSNHARPPNLGTLKLLLHDSSVEWMGNRKSVWSGLRLSLHHHIHESLQRAVRLTNSVCS